MKTFMLAFLVSSTFLSMSAMAADYSIVNCSSVSGNARALRLIIVNQEIQQVRIRVNSHRERALTPARVQDQNVEGFTLYSFAGSPALMEVENQILSGDAGTLKLANEELSCM